MALRLPPEIYDLVIDNLSNDYRSLKQVALTCRSWLPRSRKYLFESVALVSMANWNHFASCVAWNSPRRPLTPCSDYVKCINLSRPMSYERYASLLPLLKNVEVLFISGDTILDFVDNQILRDCFTRSVTTLHLKSANLPDTETLRLFLAGFSQLRSLNMVLISCDIPSSTSLPREPTPSTHNSISVEQLDIQECSSEVESSIARWLVKSSLCEVHVPFYGRDSYMIPSKIPMGLCHAAGAALREMHLHFKSVTDHGKRLHISYSCDLEELTASFSDIRRSAEEQQFGPCPFTRCTPALQLDRRCLHPTPEHHFRRARDTFRLFLG